MLPTVGDGFGRKLEVVGQEFVGLPFSGSRQPMRRRRGVLPLLTTSMTGAEATSPFLCRNDAQGKSERHNLMVTASMLNSLDLKWNLWLARWACTGRTFRRTNLEKRPAERESSTSTNMERSTFFRPQRYRRFPAAAMQRGPARMERRAASRLNAMTANCSFLRLFSGC